MQAKAAGPVYWDWPKIEAFSDLELDGATVDTQGFLMSGMAATSFTGEGPEVYWCIISDGRGGYFTGTGHGGKILHTDKNGDVSLFAELEGTEVFSLLLLADGSLLAGCGPEGEVYRLDKNGDSTLLDKVPGGYAWSMLEDEASQSVFIVGGSPAALYRLQKDDALVLVKEFPAQNALDVVVASDGGLLVSTQGPGFIFHLDANLKNTRLLLEMPQDEARQFMYGPEGDLFVVGFNGEEQESALARGLAPGGDSDKGSMLSMLFGETEETVARSAIYRLEDDGTAVSVWTSEKEFMVTAWDEKLGWFGGGALDEDSGQSILYALDFPAGEHPLAMWVGGDILDVLIPDSRSDAELIVCQAFPGSVTALSNRGDKPHEALSTPLDGGQPIRWGRLSWDGLAGKGKPQWSVRGGNSSVPDDSWTDWTASWTASNHAIDLDPCRFLQWKVAFPKNTKWGQSWLLSRVSVSAWQENSAPVIEKFDLEQRVSLEPGSIMGGSDNVMQFFRSGLLAEFSHTSTSEKTADPALMRMVQPVYVFSWDVSDAEDEQLIYTLMYRKTGTEGWRNIISDSPETLGSWDTSEVMDGQYEVQLMASDKKNNPYRFALSSKGKLGPFKVDNQAPVIKKLRLEKVPTGFHVRFTVIDGSSDIAGAQIRLPDGSLERLDPRDGICDSVEEIFDTVVLWPRPCTTMASAAEEGSAWVVGIGIQDMGGNITSVEGEVR